MTMTLRKTLQGLVRAWTEEPPGILTEKLSLVSPSLDLWSRAPDSRDSGGLCQVGFGLWAGMTGSNDFPAA